MKHYLILALAFFILSCGSTEKLRQADGSFDYINTKLGNAIDLPSSIKQNQNSQYFIKETAFKEENNLAQNVDIRSPLQVINSGGSNEIVFLANEDFLFSIHNDFAKEYANIYIEIESYIIYRKSLSIVQENDFQADKIQRIEVVHSQDLNKDASWFSKLFLGKKERKLSHYFEIVLRPNFAQKDIKLQVTHLKSSVNNKEISNITFEDKNRLEKAAINSFITHIQKQKSQDQQTAENLRKIEFILSKKDERLILVNNISFDDTWRQMPIILAKLGFEIEKREKDKGTYFTKYVGNEALWKSVWKKKNDVKINYGTYEILIGLVDENSSSISIINEQGKPIKDSILEQLKNILNEHA